MSDVFDSLTMLSKLIIGQTTKGILTTTFLVADRKRIEVCIDKHKLDNLSYKTTKIKSYNFSKTCEKVDICVKTTCTAKKEGAMSYILDMQSLLIKSDTVISN